MKYTYITSHGIRYKIDELGTAFHEDTADEVVNLIEAFKSSGKRAIFHLGDAKTGRDWEESPTEITGTIGRSGGDIKIPLLIKKSTSRGGASLLDNCIVKVETTGRNKTILYQHSKYHKGQNAEDIEEEINKRYKGGLKPIEQVESDYELERKRMKV